jgi:hypothetical protein
VSCEVERRDSAHAHRLFMAVKVAGADREFLTSLVTRGLAASLAGAVAVACRLAKVQLEREEEREDFGGKRERVSVGVDERARRAIVSERELGELWHGMANMMRATPTEMDGAELREALASDLFPGQWKSLLLQIPEQPSRGQLSRLAVAYFLVEGSRASQELWQGKCVREFSALNVAFEHWTETDKPFETLVPVFKSKCPMLAGLFSLVTAESKVEDNKLKTVEFKQQTFIILVAALGKVRAKHNSACGKFLFWLWRSLGAPVELNDCLASLGLSIFSKRGNEQQAALIKKVMGQIEHRTNRTNSSKVFYASSDNVDESFKSRKHQIGSRDQSLHFISSTLYRFVDSRIPTWPGCDDSYRGDILDISILFASNKANENLAALCVNNLGRLLCPLVGGFVFNGKPLVFRTKAVAPELVSLGLLEKTETFPLPTENFSQSSMSEFYAWEKGFLGRFPDSEKVLVAADAKTYLLMKKSQKMHQMERLTACDCDDSKAIPVPDWFHMSVNVFLGECTRNNFVLLQQFCSLIGGSYVINASVGKSMNDTMRVFTAFYPVAVARLFQYFLTNVAREVGINPVSTEFMSVVRRFWLWIIYTTKTINSNGQPVREFQRHCRLVLVLAVYNVMWESSRCADHDALVDILHWILPIVCQGPFSQYRAVVIDALAYYHRASDVDKFLYKQSFTVNHTGKAFGNTPTGKVQEYINKKIKVAKRRDPARSEEVGAETALLQHHRDVEERLAIPFPHLKDSSEGVTKLPDAKVVLGLMNLVHWTALSEPVLGKDASFQKPLMGVEQNKDHILKSLRRIGRAAQFGVDEAIEEDVDSEDECEEQE